ncbi:BLOC-1-related complex subunit 8 isoform 2, partial [Daubentonia madagascariensis]
SRTSSPRASMSWPMSHPWPCTGCRSTCAAPCPSWPNTSAVKNLVDSSVYFRSVEGLLKQAISIRDHMNATAQGHR